jgi:hypothetical protein
LFHKLKRNALKRNCEIEDPVLTHHRGITARERDRFSMNRYRAPAFDEARSPRDVFREGEPASNPAIQVQRGHFPVDALNIKPFIGHDLDAETRQSLVVVHR